MLGLHRFLRKDPFADARTESSLGALPDITSFNVEHRVDLVGGDLIDVVDLGAVPPAAHDHTVAVALVPDPFGVDSNAVKVHVDGRRVGRLRAADAQHFAPFLHDLLWRGCIARVTGLVTCDARGHRLVLRMPLLDR